MIKHEEALRISDEDFKYKNEEMRTMENFLKSQIEAYKKEKETADTLLQSRERELERERKETRETFSKIE